MHAVSVSGLKHNPAEALRQARSGPALATALFRDGELSLVRAPDLDTLEQWLQSSSPTPVR